MDRLPRFFRSMTALLLLLFTCIGANAAVHGDVNGDGQVTVTDVTAVYNIVLGTSEDYKYSADVNGDGQVTVTDITAVYDIILGVTSAVDDDELFDDCYATLRSEQPIDGMDASVSGFVRDLFFMNDVTSDVATCVWFDSYYTDLAVGRWGSDSKVCKGMFLRLCKSIDICNTYLSRSSYHVAQDNAEARFLRALYYYYLMDLYGRVPINTDATVPTRLAAQNTRAEVLNFVIQELNAIEDDLAEPRSNIYGRVDKAAAWLLLARAYIGAQVYSPTNRTTTRKLRLASAKENALNVINSSYGLYTTAGSNYSAFQSLFLADNNSNGAQREIILPIVFTGHEYPSLGDWEYTGNTFLVAATTSYNYESFAPSGINGQWAGIVARSKFVTKFNPPLSAAQTSTAPETVANAIGDKRGLFVLTDKQPGITNKFDFSDGWAYYKWRNMKANGSSSNLPFADTDVPLMRAAEAYLIYAEADAQLNSGSCTSDGLEKLNAVRARSGASTLTTANIATVGDEWAREFAFEGMRRTVLVRNGWFGVEPDDESIHSNALWQWKGDDQNGRQIGTEKNLFPIPADVLAENSNMTQNPGYDIDFGQLTLTVNDTVFMPQLNSNIGLELSWTPATSSSYAIYPRYRIEMSADGEFTNEVSLYASKMSPGDYCVFDDPEYATSGSVSADNLMLFANLAGSNRVWVRITADCSGFGKAVSNVVKIRVEKLWWLVGTDIGDGQMDNSSSPILCNSMVPMMPISPGVMCYAGYIRQGATFYLLENAGDWYPRIGQSSSGKIEYAKDAESGLAQQPITFTRSSGFYRIRLFTDLRLVSFTALAGTPETYSSIGLLGDFSYWSDDTYFMSLDTWSGAPANAKHNWRLRDFTLSSDSDCKLRPNGAWETTWGATTSETTPLARPFNVLLNDLGSYNLRLGADHYTAFYFNDILGTFIYIR